MNRCCSLTAWALALLPGISGCVDATRPPRVPAAARAAVNPGPEDFEGRLLEIAARYECYERSGPVPRWAPQLCAGTIPAVPGLSRSNDVATHGRKMYWLFVKEKPEGFLISGSYTVEGKPNPVGQVVVKEAWIPEEAADDGRRLEVVSSTTEVRDGDRRYVNNDYIPYARDGGKLYHAKEKAGLFVMFKVDPGTAGTDEGWVYGTVTADGKKVTSAGRVESCMGCHRQAPHDRLFGLPDKEGPAPLRPAAPPSP
jgi:hypothetical protein